MGFSRKAGQAECLPDLWLSSVSNNAQHTGPAVKPEHCGCCRNLPAGKTSCFSGPDCRTDVWHFCTILFGTVLSASLRLCLYLAVAKAPWSNPGFYTYRTNPALWEPLDGCSLWMPSVAVGARSCGWTPCRALHIATETGDHHWRRRRRGRRVRVAGQSRPEARHHRWVRAQKVGHVVKPGCPGPQAASEAASARHASLSSPQARC